MTPSVTYDQIVTERTRPTLVLAGPGAGKTYLLGDRVKRLLDSGVDHASITVLTFGTDAEHNVRNKLLDPNSGFGIPHERLPRVSTLHALGFEIAKAKPKVVGLRKTDLRVQSDGSAVDVLYRDAALSSGLSELDAHAARKCKARGECRPDTGENRCKVCHAYWHIMAKCNCIDFDDQVLFACRVLEGDKDLLGTYQAACRHLLVDEYQDINAAQFRLIELLSRRSPEGLFVVGDDAQSIYGFRGATPEFILRFSGDFVGAWSPPLAYSRRCPESILRPAQAVLAIHYPRWTGPQVIEYSAPNAVEPKVWQVPSEDAEAQWVARVARQAAGEHKTVLVLAPKSAFFSRLSRALSDYGVAHDCQEDLLPDSVSDRLGVAWRLVEWVQEPTDSLLTRAAIECVINNGTARVPGAEKGKRCKPETIAARIRVETEISLLWRDVTSTRSLMAALESLSSPSAELRAARDVLCGLRESFIDCKGDRKGEFAKRLALACGSWTRPETFAKDLLSLKHEVTGSRTPGFSSVQLMTLRKAKGLEADVVVMVGLEDDILPGTFADVEEQARLFYVGMTRAKGALYLIHSFKRPRDVSFGEDIMDKPRSRFLDTLGIKSKYMKDGSRTA